MTRYEELMEKADACLSAALRVGSKSYMGNVWLTHMRALEEMARDLSVQDSEVSVDVVV